MKNLTFAKDDILSALLDLTKDSMARGELTRSLVNAKIERLVSKKQFENRKLEQEFGGLHDIEHSWKKLSEKSRTKINKKIKIINSLINQIAKLREYREELILSSFSNEPLNKLESNIKRVFKWEKPVQYNDIFKRG